MYTKLIVPVVFVAALPWLISPAAADCQANAATVPIDGGNDVIVCDNAVGGSDTNGVNAAAGNDSVTVLAGSSVAGTMNLGAGTDALVNNGNVSTAGVEEHVIFDPDGFATITHNLNMSTSGPNSTGIFSVFGGNNIVDIDGNILTAGENAEGVNLGDDNNSVTVRGARLIETEGDDSIAIRVVDGSNNTVDNRGNLDTAGESADGIFLFGGANSVTNSGSIITRGGDANGIWMRHGDNVVDNSRNIETFGIGSTGILVDLGDGNRVINSGDIRTHLLGSDAIRVMGYGGPGTSIDHSGTIETTSTDADGISVVGDGHVVESSGFISTEGGAGTADAGRIAGAQGIEIVGHGNRVLHSGSITTGFYGSAVGADGIAILGDGLGSSTISLDNSGTIITLDTDADAISVVGDNHTIVNSGALSTAGNSGTEFLTGRHIGAQGIEVIGDANVINNTATGTIATTGARASGMFVDGTLNQLTNEGAIDTQSFAAAGIDVAGTENEALNAAGASITTLGDQAHGMHSGGDFNVLTNAGDIRAEGTSSGMAVSLASDNQLINEATGAITIVNNGSGMSAAFGDRNTLINAGAITTALDGGAGIRVFSGSDSTLRNTGSIQTMGNATSGLSADGDGNSLSNAGTISTSVSGALGMRAVGGNNQLSTSATSVITTTGDFADGIGASGLDNFLINAGDITTAGESAIGIRAVGDNNLVINSGTSIHTTGVDADGIRIVGDSTMTTPSVDNTGLIETTGEDADGIAVIGNGHSVQNSGTINTSGASGGVGGPDGTAGRLFGAQGIEIVGNNNTLTQGGTIATTGAFADGVAFKGTGNSATNLGAISTDHQNASGMQASGDNNQLLNNGGATIATAGAGSNGLFASQGNDNRLTNYGSIQTDNNAASGMQSVLGDTNQLLNTGSIVTHGSNAYGMATQAGNDNILTNNGLIETSDNNAHAMFTDGNGNNLTNSGRVATSGSTAYGLSEIGDNNTLTNTTSGVITTNGAGADGVWLEGTDNILNNDGTIETSDASAFGVYVLGSSTGTQIFNSGLIDSSGTCVGVGGGGGGGSVNLSSSGTMNCGSGVAAELGADNDTVILVDNSLTNGHLNVAGGNDGIVLDTATGTSGVLNGAIHDAESVIKTGDGMFTVNGDAEVGFTSLHVNAGTLTLNSGTLTGNTHIAPAGTLISNNYAYNGNIDNAGVLDSNANVLSVSGSYTQTGTGELRITSNLDGSVSTRVEAGGSATLDGAVDVSITDPGNLVLGYNDVVLVDAAGGRSGTFASLTDNVTLADTTASLIYNSDQAIYRLTLPPKADSLLAFGEAAATTMTQVGRTVDQRLRVIRAGRNNADSTRLADRARALSTGGTPASVDKTPAGTGLWFQAYANDAELDGGALPGFDTDTAGALIGYDLSPTQGLALGAAAGYGQTTVDSGDAGGQVQTLFVNLYASQEIGPGYVEARALWSDLDFDTGRSTRTGDTARTEHGGDAWGASLAGGIDITDNLMLFNQVAWTRVDEDAYVETGVPGFNQAIEPEALDVLHNRLGVRLGGLIDGNAERAIHGWVEVAWVHDFDVDDAEVAARPAGAPGPVVVATRDDISQDGIDLRAGMAWLVANGTTISIQVHGQKRGNYRDFGAGLQFGVAF